MNNLMVFEEREVLGKGQVYIIERLIEESIVVGREYYGA